MKLIIVALLALVHVACSTTAHQRKPAEASALAAAEDPFLGCRVNTLDFRGRVVNSTPFELKLRQPGGTYLDAELPDHTRVRLMHNNGRQVNFSLDGRPDPTGTPSYFAVATYKVDGGGSFGNRRIGGLGYDASKSVFEMVVDPSGRLTGGHGGSGFGGDDYEAVLERVNQQVGESTWYQVDGARQYVTIVVCGSMS